MIVSCIECGTRIDTENSDDMRHIDTYLPDLKIYYCSSDCRIRQERREEGIEITED